MHSVYFGVLYDYRAYKTLLREQVLASRTLTSGDPEQQGFRPMTEDDASTISSEYERIAELYRAALGMETFDYVEMDYGTDKYEFPQPKRSFDLRDLKTISNLPAFKLRVPKVTIETFDKAFLYTFGICERFTIDVFGPLLDKAGSLFSQVWKSHSPVQALLSVLIPEKSPRAIAEAKARELPAQITQ